MTILARHSGPPCQKVRNTNYKPTIALANVLFTAPGLDAINYPSVASGDNGINVCMLPDKADQLFVPKEAWMIRLGERAAHPEKGAPIWRTDFLQRSKKIGPDGIIKWWAPGEGINQAEVMNLLEAEWRALPSGLWPYRNDTRKEFSSFAPCLPRTKNPPPGECPNTERRAVLRFSPDQEEGGRRYMSASLQMRPNCCAVAK